MNKNDAYIQLARLAGKWNTDGKILATATTPEVKVQGTDVYEWLPGRFFLLHTVDVVVGDDKNETTEIIGYDEEKNMYTMQHYDNKGNSGFMTGTCVDEVWTFLGDSLKFTGGFKNSDKEFSGVWEQPDDNGNWQQFMDIKLTRTAR